MLLCPGGLAAARETRGPLHVVDDAVRQVGLFEESHALVIGASDYTVGWPVPPGVKRDVRAAVKRACKAS